MLKFGKSTLLMLAFLALGGFSIQKSASVPVGGQPTEERQAQEMLPQSHDAMWTTLLKTKIHVNEKKGLYSATYPPEVKALVGKQVTISGFILPLEATQKFKHFILAKRTPTCPFCPPGEPNEIVDIWLDKPIAFTENLIKVTGTFGFENKQELGMFFKLTKAEKL